MKLWKRRPLSVDLSKRELTAPDEGPPALFYISPGINRISKRSSIGDKEEMQLTSKIIPDHVNLHSHHRMSCDEKSLPLKSFCDYNPKNSVSFDDGTLKSSKILNKDCKSYLSPVSQEWHPVKDVMKIKRSASVPFKGQSAPTSKPVGCGNEANKFTMASQKANVSISEKLKTFFRYRSSSRSSKHTNSEDNSSNIICSLKTDGMTSREKDSIRSSRSRNKAIDRCKSLYVPSTVNTTDAELGNKLSMVLQNSVMRSYGDAQTRRNFEGDSWQIKNEKIKSVKNCENLREAYRRVKNGTSDPIKQNKTSHKLSGSVVSHTVSSAAKCKTPHSNGVTQSFNIDSNKHRTKKHLEHRINVPFEQQQQQQLPNYKTSSIIVQSTCDNCRSNVFPFEKSSKPVVVLRNNTNKQDVNCRMNGSTRQKNIEPGNREKMKYILPDRMNIPISDKSAAPNNSTKSKPPVGAEDEDYVTLAQIDMALNNSIMTQSLLMNPWSDTHQLDHEYENHENFQMFQRASKALRSDHRRDSLTQKPPSSVRQRPTSCMELISQPVPTTMNSNVPQMSLKSPYLSQYSKLYSLRMFDADNSQSTEADGLFQCYAMEAAVNFKEQISKTSTDSGLIDDINSSLNSEFHLQSLS